jgi:protein-tyrosine phosphatase
METTRELNWDGLSNVRDLGGLPLGKGRTTKFHQVVRSDHPSKANLKGWQEMWDYGIRTVISFETVNLPPVLHVRENPPLGMPSHVAGIKTIRMPVQDASDAEYMRAWAETRLWGTPLFFRDALEKWPGYYADILNAIAAAEGGVLIHCVRDHDRTGVVAALLLTLIGAEKETVIRDYMYDSPRFAVAAPDAHQAVHTALESAGTSLEEAFEVISSPATVANLIGAGLTPDTIEALQNKLLGAPRAH